MAHKNVFYSFVCAVLIRTRMCFQVVFFTNSGTEANELALMMARLYTGCHDIISLRNGYHGNAAATMGATAQCNYKFNVVQVYFLPHFFVRSLQILCMCKSTCVIV